MPTKQQVLNQILAQKVVAIVRLSTSEAVVPTVEALHAGGIVAIEVTVGTPGALRHIERYADHASVLIGAGSVIDAESAQAAIEAGAKFLVTPVSKASVIETAQRYQVPVFSGAFTPGEILQAVEWGADVVKVFPADALGMKYFKAVLAPMPHLPLMPTGGVTLDNAKGWLAAGACALGVGSALTNKKAIAEGNYEQITQNARRFLMNVEG
ncbi:MAG: bifunctional 4-hydroxy-2-oxoglutarate aldolase/2-dehydro-3-deoxy-phosphogluconate aldolase [Tunicatimonas sp.]